MNSCANNPGTAEATSHKEGIGERLKSILDSLHRLSGSMRQAVVSRDIRSVWSILAEQEALIAEFEQYSCLWSHLVSINKDSKEFAETSRRIDESFDLLRRRNRGNMSLIKSFLSAINKSFKHVNTAGSRSQSVYGRHGRMQYKQSSLVLSRVG